jgi:hypothetical protein
MKEQSTNERDLDPEILNILTGDTTADDSEADVLSAWASKPLWEVKSLLQSDIGEAALKGKRLTADEYLASIWYGTLVQLFFLMFKDSVKSGNKNVRKLLGRFILETKATAPDWLVEAMIQSELGLLRESNKADFDTDLWRLRVGCLKVIASEYKQLNNIKDGNIRSLIEEYLGFHNQRNIGEDLSSLKKQMGLDVSKWSSNFLIPLVNCLNHFADSDCASQTANGIQAGNQKRKIDIGIISFDEWLDFLQQEIQKKER